MQVEVSAMIAAALVVLSVSLMSTVAAWSGGCAEELLSFSPCLPYVSSPPNNLTDMASPNCCNALHSQSQGSLCLCYLLRDPLFLGFPVNTTSLLSLSSLCIQQPPLPSLNLLCSESPSLPPLTSPPDAPAPGGSSGRMIPGSTGMGESHFPILNGAAAPSTQFWNTLILSQILTILLVIVSANSTL